MKQPTTILGFVVVAIVAVIFFIVGMYMTGSTSLACQRVESTKVDCTITQHRWLGLMTDENQLKDVEKARSESYSCNDKKKKQRNTCYRLVIETQHGEVRPDFLSDDDYAIEINQFLTSTQPTLTISQWDWIGGAVFMGLGALVFLIVTSVALTGPATR